MLRLKYKKIIVCIAWLLMAASFLWGLPQQQNPIEYDATWNTAAQITQPQQRASSDYKLPEDGVGRALEQVSGITREGRDSRGTRFFVLCLIMPSLLFAFALFFRRRLGRENGEGSTITLRRNVRYIHRMDGEKRSVIDY